MNGLGYFLVVWMVMVSNVGADVRSAMDSVFVDVIKGNYYGAMVRCEDVIAADSTAVDAQRFLGWLQIATKQGDLRTAASSILAIRLRSSSHPVRLRFEVMGSGEVGRSSRKLKRIL